MKTRTKVILDEWFGKFAVIILNVVARVLGAILSIDHSLDKPAGRIVVCKFLGMGSIIQATPLLQTLRIKFPSAEIVFVTSRSNLSLMQSIDIVDKVLCIDDKSAWRILASTFSLLKALWSRKPDLYLDLETYSYYSTAIATLSCARNRFGFYRIERNIRMGVYTHMMFFNARAAIAQSYLQMARLAGCKDIIESLYHFNIPDESRLQAKAKLTTFSGGKTGDAIIINPNASDLRVERRWPAQNFVELVDRLCKVFPEKTFLLIGAVNEFEWVQGIHDRIEDGNKSKVFNTAGSFSLNELFAVIDSSVLVITNDTGPMHISFSLGKPTISLFGPASPSQYGQNPNALGIYKNIYCSPCVHDFITPPCKGDNQCMKLITVEEVLTLAKQAINKSRVVEVTAPPTMIYLKEDGNTSLGIIGRE